MIAGAIFATIPAFAAEKTGSICVAPLSKNAREIDHDLPRGVPQRREPAYEFSVTIDTRKPIEIPVGGRAQLLTGLDPNVTHRVVIRDAGVQIESFEFSFAARGALHLCLEYGPWYQSWILDPPMIGNRSCECATATNQPSNSALEPTGEKPPAAERQDVRPDMSAYTFTNVLERAGDKPIRVLARISVLSTEDGGREGPRTGKWRPDHNFGEPTDRVFFIGQVEVPEGSWVYPGETRDLVITFLNVRGLSELLHVGRTWRLQEGPIHVATGELLAVLREA